MDWITIITSVLSMLGVGGCGLLFYKQTRTAKELENKGAEISNEASTNAEWIKLYREVKDELSLQRDAKIELRNEIMELKLEQERLKCVRCFMADCDNRQPPQNKDVVRSVVNEYNQPK